MNKHLIAALAAVFITSAPSAPAQTPWQLGILTTNSDVDPAPLPAGAGWTTTSFQVAMPGMAKAGISCTLDLIEKLNAPNQ